MKDRDSGVRFALCEIPPPGEWAEKANCRGKDPEVFFGPPGRPTTEARVLCAECDVRANCLDYALTYPGLVGVWAGTTRLERLVLRRAA